MNKLIHSVANLIKTVVLTNLALATYIATSIDIIRLNRKHARIIRKHKQLQKQYPNIKIIR